MFGNCDDGQSAMVHNAAILLAIAVGLWATDAAGAIAVTNDVIPALVSGDPWDVGGSLSIGELLAGEMTIDAGSQVSNTDAYVANILGSSGVVTVQGVGSSWQSTGELRMGNGGTGTLKVNDGATVSVSGNTRLGNLPAAVGIATIDGTGSTLSSTNFVLVGREGRGTLNILNGGSVSDLIGGIAVFEGSFGAATIDGIGSSWSNSDELQVADSGAAVLNILNGGTATSPRGFIGISSDGIGNVVVSGSSSQWNNSDQLQVGYGGGGTLDVTAGGLVTSNLGYVGTQFGGNGTANVDGIGSAWNSGSELSIGYEGTGTLRITGGGVVSSPIATVGYQSTGSGSAIVDGLGSIWITTQSLTVGKMGVGTLAVSNGGLVVAGTVEGGGELALNGGTLRLMSSDSVSNPVVLNAGGGAFDVPESGSVVALAGSLSGPGELVKTGTGVLQIAGSGSHAGHTRVVAGELQLNSGLLPDAADVYLAAAGILALAFSETDEIGSLFIDGVAQPKGTYGGTGSGADFEVPQITGAGLLRVTGVGLPGDYNVDGVVDAADYTTWRDQLGASAALANDPTLGVGRDDYYRWQMQFGAASADGGTSGQSAVPEPHLVIQFLMLAFCLPLARIGGRS